jgi:hypothetical protein
VSVWGGQYREEEILDINQFIVWVCGRELKEELLLNFIVFFVMFGVR